MALYIEPSVPLSDSNDIKLAFVFSSYELDIVVSVYT